MTDDRPGGKGFEDNLCSRFLEEYRSPWVKIKYYREKPKLREVKKARNVRFCEATRQAVRQPLLLDQSSLSCPSAQYVFGWSGDREKLMAKCRQETQAGGPTLRSLASFVPHFRRSYPYIGLNTEGVPDLMISYALPEIVMKLIRKYNFKTGKNLKTSFLGMAPICGGIAVKTFLDGEICLSFGCRDSRRLARMDGGRVAVGIPRKYFSLFIDT